MIDPILQKAVDRKIAALREAEKWSEFIDMFLELSPEAWGAVGRASQARTEDREQSKRLAVDSELAKTIAIVSTILDARGHPVPRDDLFEEATRRGLVVGGKKPIDNFGARLHNSGHFRSISKKEGWWFRDRPLPVTSDTSDAESTDTKMDAPNSSELFGAPKLNGAEPLRP